MLGMSMARRRETAGANRSGLELAARRTRGPRTGALGVSIALLVAAVLPLAAAPGQALELELQSRTYVPAREDGAGNFHAGFYEYLDIGVEEMPVPGLFLRLGGWGRFDLAEETYGRTSNGELQYGYLGWRGSARDVELRLGRLVVTGGAARAESLDGLEVRGGLGAGFELAAYGGIPLETDAGGRSGDLLYGARLSQGRPGVYTAGISYLNETDDGEAVRDEAALDLWWRPASPLALEGFSLYNVEESTFARHDYRLSAGPFLSRLRLAAAWGRVDYGAYFSNPDTSAFAAPHLEPGERLDTVGGEAAVDLAGGFRLGAEFTAHRYEILGDAESWGGKLEWSRGPFGAGASWRQVRGEDERLRYDEIRVHASAVRRDLTLAAGYQQVRYEAPVNGVDAATTATLAAALALSPTMAVGADVEYGSDPAYESSWRGMLSVTWGLRTSGRR